LPKDVPGYANLSVRRTEFNKLLKELHFIHQNEIQIARTGKGKLILGDDISALLKAANVFTPLSPSTHLSFITRTNENGKTYFISNRTDKETAQWVAFADGAKTVAFFDPMMGKNGLAKWKKDENGFQAWIVLKPFESVILRTYKEVQHATPFIYSEKQMEGEEIKGKWNVEFLNGGPVLPSNFVSEKLISWTENNENGKNFSGTARYSIPFNKPAGDAKTWLLDLGTVHETAEVFLNGKKIATLIGPVFQTTIDASQLKPVNQLEIVVANLMANRIAYMDRNHLPWKIFYNTNMPARKKENSKNGLFDASDWQPLPSGLLGPVTIAPVKSSTP
jgi:hypothetical protein